MCAVGRCGLPELELELASLGLEEGVKGKGAGEVVVMEEEVEELLETVPNSAQVTPEPISVTVQTLWSWSVKSSLSSLQLGSWCHLLWRMS